ncbi:ImmA/IrrE family metallo-endopeptidase, partial [Jatrophihabitans lederbergiae]
IEAWGSIWAKPSAAFLKSPAFEAHQGAVAVWLRLGELEAISLHCEPFQKAALKQLLPQLRELTRVPFPDFCYELQDRCAAVGVAVVYVPEIEGARSSGATRWLSPTKAIVQLSDRGKKSDRFWFAFFHELGHVLLHGKRDIFVDDDKIGDDAESDQEKEASDFARELLIPATLASDLVRAQTQGDVVALADRAGVSPAIVAGRIRHDRSDYTFCHGVDEHFEIGQIPKRPPGR